MKQRMALIIGLFISSMVAAQSGYEIAIELKPFANSYVYLGYYYGDVRALSDSVKLDAQSKGTFKGSEALPGGIYFVVSPSKQILFELLLDKDQHFNVSADTSTLPSGVVFSGSA